MKKIDSSNIIGTVKAPYVKQTFDHYNEAIQETVNGAISGLIPQAWQSGYIVVLSGVVVLATVPGSSVVTAGWAYYNGEIFQVDANASIVTTGSETLVWVIETTYASGDPVQYSDGSSHNQHAIRKLKLQAGASGSGIMNYNSSNFTYFVYALNALYLGDLRKVVVNIGSWDMDATASVNVSHTIPQANIRSVTAIILNDDQDSSYMLNSYSQTLNDGSVNGGTRRITDAIVELFRTPSADFDDTLYNDSSINRGYLIIEYDQF